MRRFNLVFPIFTPLLLTLLLLTTVPAFSQEAMRAQASEGNTQEAIREAKGGTQPATPAKSPRGDASQSERGTQKPIKPRIITDEKTSTVRVLIDGKEILTIDAEGLHVHGDIDYSGVITDTGEAPHEK